LFEFDSIKWRGSTRSALYKLLGGVSFVQTKASDPLGEPISPEVCSSELEGLLERVAGHLGRPSSIEFTWEITLKSASSPWVVEFVAYCPPDVRPISFAQAFDRGFGPSDWTCGPMLFDIVEHESWLGAMILADRFGFPEDAYGAAP